MKGKSDMAIASTEVIRRSALRSPWRKSFADVAPSARRAARYALQMVARCPKLHARLHEDEFLGALWGLSLPLIDPDKLAKLRDDWYRDVRPEKQEVFDGQNFIFTGRSYARPEEHELPSGMAGVRMREYLLARFMAIPNKLLKRLALADGEAPTHQSVVVLAESIGLNAVERHVLDFLEKKETILPFRLFLRESGSDGVREHHAYLAAALDVPLAELQQCLQRQGTLTTLDLIQKRAPRGDLEDFVKSAGLFDDLMALEPSTPEELLAAVVEPAAALECSLDEFPHLAREGARLRAVLGKAARARRTGVNALLYGPPGSGKTQFASAVAQAAGLQAYQVKSANDAGDGLSRTGRLGAYKLTQRLLRGRSDCVLVFDEVEDVFGQKDNAAARSRGSNSRAGLDKGWTNRTLEDNPLPAIWITNDAQGMDPAFLRRFLLPVAFVTPPRQVRRQMVERHLGDTELPHALLDELASDAALVPAHFGTARRLLDLCEGESPERVVREGVAAARRVLHGTARQRVRLPATRFDTAYLNVAGGVTPEQLSAALERNGEGAVCFFGPPGTGKTAFANALADTLDRELVAISSSDLLSPHVGETERNIAQVFSEIDREHAILLLDEVDSLLRDRHLVRHSWEVTQVNELLQQMERFDGIFIAATNLIGQLDAAAMRRFDFKLQFRALSRPQRLSLFAREVLGDEKRVADIPPALASRLETLDTLTAGAFANVVRQGKLIGESLSAEEFLRRLVSESRCREDMLAAASHDLT